MSENTKSWIWGVIFMCLYFIVATLIWRVIKKIGRTMQSKLQSFRRGNKTVAAES